MSPYKLFVRNILISFTHDLDPVYNGTKAWVHFWSMNLRAQLKDTKIKVIEIAPPTVATDLHRE